MTCQWNKTESLERNTHLLLLISIANETAKDFWKVCQDRLIEKGQPGKSGKKKKNEVGPLVNDASKNN